MLTSLVFMDSPRLGVAESSKADRVFLTMERRYEKKIERVLYFRKIISWYGHGPGLLMQLMDLRDLTSYDA